MPLRETMPPEFWNDANPDLIELSYVLRLLADRNLYSDADVPPYYGLALRAISIHGRMRASQLSTVLVMNRASVSRLLTRMVRDGYVETEPDPEDGRARLVRATPAGEELSRLMLSKSANITQEIFADWDPDELAQFNRQCRRITRASWRILGIDGPDRKESKSVTAAE
jgi:DNA-binding MarR family transcriptional regulator